MLDKGRTCAYCLDRDCVSCIHMMCAPTPLTLPSLLSLFSQVLVGHPDSAAMGLVGTTAAIAAAGSERCGAGRAKSLESRDFHSRSTAVVAGAAVVGLS